MTIATEYPRLVQFFGGYFNQDEVEDAAGWKELVSNFLAREPQSTAEAVLEELTKLLEDPRLGQSPYAVLSDLACDYEPTGDHLIPTEWLCEIRSQLLRALARR